MTLIAPHLPTISRHQPSTALRFGVRFNTKYGDNLNSSILQDALTLRQLQDNRKAELDAIPDQIDPFRVKISFDSGRVGTWAEITTENNGKFSLEYQKNDQTPIETFFNTLVSKMALVAPTLKSLDQIKQDTPQTADKLISEVLKAYKQNPQMETHSYQGGQVMRYYVQNDAGKPYCINIARVLNMPNSPKFYIGIIENATETPNRLDYKITPDNQHIIDYAPQSRNTPFKMTPEDNGQESFDTIRTRMMELAEVLEGTKSIDSVDLSPQL
jgi:restriction endonuclease